MSESETRGARQRAAHDNFSPLGALRRHWIFSTAIILVFTAAFVAYGYQRDPVYTAEIRLAVGSGQMSNLAIPGFPSASRDLAADYARWVTNRGVADTDAPSGTSSLTASPIPESNVIRIQATSTEPQTAVKAAQGAGDALMREVNRVAAENDPQLVQDEIVQDAPALARSQTAASAALARYQAVAATDGESSAAAQAALENYTQLNSNQVRLATIQDGRLARYRLMISNQSTEADLRTVGRGAQVISNDHSSAIQRFGLLGLFLGAAIALGSAVALENRRRQTGLS